MVKDKRVFKTACGLFVHDAAYDDLSFMGKDWIWCYCPYEKGEGECPSRIPYAKFNHCEPQPTGEEYNKQVSVERALEQRNTERDAALQDYYRKHGDKFKGCYYCRYDFKAKKIVVSSDAIKTCMYCERCAWIEGDEQAAAIYKIVCDVTVTERFDCGDMFGTQENVSKYERYTLSLASGYCTEKICERYIKNEDRKWLFRRVDEICINGCRWGSIRDVFLRHTPEGYFASRGWVTGEIIVECSEPYIIAKATRKTPQMAMLAKAQKEKRLNIYRRRIRNYLNWVPGADDSKAYVASRQRKLELLSEKYPDIYSDELKHFNKKKHEVETKKSMQMAQISLL